MDRMTGICVQSGTKVWDLLGIEWRRESEKRRTYEISASKIFKQLSSEFAFWPVNTFVEITKYHAKSKASQSLMV